MWLSTDQNWDDEMDELAVQPARLRALSARQWLVLALLLPALALAQSAGGPYVMRKQAVAAGGGAASGGSYSLRGTIAETAASQRTVGGTFHLTGGLHPPGAVPDRLLCDGFEGTPCP
jgi:hypothetical protein